MTRSAVTTAILLLLAGVTSGVSAQRTDINRRIQENQRRLDSIRLERSRLQDDLQRLEGQAHTISGELENIERQKSTTSRIVNELDRQIGSLSAELDTVTLDLLLAEDALAETRAILDKRLVEIYKRGSLWIFEVLLAAESFGDLLSRYKYLYLVSRQDRALTRSVEELRDRVSAHRGELVVGYDALDRQRDERGQELDRYSSLERRRLRALRDTRTSQRMATTRLDSLARDEERLNDIISTLEAERSRAGSAGPGTIGEGSLGNLEWPVDGPVLYRFGRQAGPDDTAIRQNGIGIRAPVGTAVRAVAAGTVNHAAPLGTYQGAVILDHGAGYRSIYLYLSRVDVQANQPVQAGQVIGLSGGANSDHGPHLEFQIRGQGGIALDPQVWLRRR